MMIKNFSSESTPNAPLNPKTDYPVQYPAAPKNVVSGMLAPFNQDSSSGHPDSGRVAVFIDGSNLFYAALQMGIEVDYTKLLSCLTANTRLLRAFFYTGVDRTNDKQQGFLLWMRRNGYRVMTKDLIQLPDGSKKANLDVEIAVDMLTLSHYCDTAILVSGDGDLAYAVNAIAYRGVRVAVVSLRSMTSDSLINVADCYIDLDTIKHEIQKPANAGYVGCVTKA